LKYKKGAYQNLITIPMMREISQIHQICQAASRKNFVVPSFPNFVQNQRDVFAQTKPIPFGHFSQSTNDSNTKTMFGIAL
jgi:hypothetical protein